jgi:hypothetical protein
MNLAKMEEGAGRASGGHKAAQNSSQNTHRGRGAARVDLTKNSGENSETRCRQNPNLKPWPKGVSGNPGGRPKRQPVSEALARLADQPFPGDKHGRTYAEVMETRMGSRRVPPARVNRLESSNQDDWTPDATVCT